MTIWVSNTSPLIFFSRLERLDILKKIAPNLIVPKGVISEIMAKQDSVSLVIEKACQEWITTESVSDIRLLEVVSANLHRGEAEAIVLAKEKKADLILLDDQEARRFATRCGLKVIGTLGLLLVAKNKKLISLIKPELDKLVSFGFRINARLIKHILTEAGEI